MAAASPGFSASASERSCSRSSGSGSSMAARNFRCPRSLASMQASPRCRRSSGRSADFCCSASSDRSASSEPSRRLSSSAAFTSASPSETRPSRNAAMAATSQRSDVFCDRSARCRQRRSTASQSLFDRARSSMPRNPTWSFASAWYSLRTASSCSAARSWWLARDGSVGGGVLPSGSASNSSTRRTARRSSCAL